ncbi:lysM domain-containing protein ARB_05157 [Colletotrichum liriopes]|uniref:LysM domain-containing protein ARB_05157 n=1 Tax=Colletotrichum liriopes TaxID=708192 RepID=A0AA37LX12_9PEZI|nr:lysM domain-containing protein ARB_05157 [Colletotrichum liriopes]
MPATTTTITENGVQTPQPTEPSIAGNRNKFHFAHSNAKSIAISQSMQLANKGYTCNTVVSRAGTTIKQFTAREPFIGNDC